ncbi:MAG: hypothetical protein EPN93_12765 [Spirochaetes bacterium]|nr:MAG: hypothetical protein EPN93_12765 [Spirochaetota bacterium]
MGNKKNISGFKLVPIKPGIYKANLVPTSTGTVSYSEIAEKISKPDITFKKESSSSGGNNGARTTQKKMSRAPLKSKKSS